MKRFLLILLFPVLTQAQSKSSGTAGNKPAASQNNKKGFVINGVVKGLPDSTMVFLTHPSQPGNMYATAYAKNGKFKLEGQTPYPDVYLLSFIGHAVQPALYLENSVVTISGDVKNLSKLTIAGTPAQADYQLYERRFNKFKVSLNELAGKINQTPQGSQRDSLIALFEVEKRNVVAEIDNFIKLKPASPVSAYVLYVTSPIGGEVADLQRRYNSLLPAARKGFYGEEIAKLSKPRIGAAGTMAIDFSQADTANRPVSLSSFKGKYVLVDFWASWCKPCRMENPAVVKAYTAFKDKNFTILSVSLDQSRENWIRAIQDDNLTWTHVSDLKFWDNAVAQLYEIKGIPANLLIDPNGKIIARDLRGEALYSTLQGLMK